MMTEVAKVVVKTAAITLGGVVAAKVYGAVKYVQGYVDGYRDKEQEIIDAEYEEV